MAPWSPLRGFVTRPEIKWGTLPSDLTTVGLPGTLSVILACQCDLGNRIMQKFHDDANQTSRHCQCTFYDADGAATSTALTALSQGRPKNWLRGKHHGAADLSEVWWLRRDPDRCVPALPGGHLEVSGLSPPKPQHGSPDSTSHSPKSSKKTSWLDQIKKHLRRIKR